MKSNIVRLLAVAVLLVCASATQLYAAVTPMPTPLPPSRPPLHSK
jgi:hypothetical protein